MGRVVSAHPVLPVGAAAEPVVINLDQALAREDPSLRTMTPLRVSAGGSVPQRLAARLGQVHARGTWMGECTFTVRSGNQRAALKLRQWLPAERAALIGVLSRSHGPAAQLWGPHAYLIVRLCR